MPVPFTPTIKITVGLPVAARIGADRIGAAVSDRSVNRVSAVYPRGAQSGEGVSLITRLAGRVFLTRESLLEHFQNFCRPCMGVWWRELQLAAEASASAF